MPDESTEATPARGNLGTGLPSPLSPDIAAAAAAVAERVLSQLLGRIYSPRIRLLSIDQVCEVTNLGRSTIYALVDRKMFPKPQRNLGRSMWRESALIAWMDANDPNQSE